MKKPSKQQLTLAASFLVLPALAVPGNAWAQRVAPERSLTISDPLKFASVYVKLAEQFTIVGVDGVRPIYRNARGEYFYLDPLTGDMRFVSPDYFSKARSRQTLLDLTSRADKYGGLVTLIGIDAQGHVVQTNARGERFYLNPTTGDMVFVK